MAPAAATMTNQRYERTSKRKDCNQENNKQIKWEILMHLIYTSSTIIISCISYMHRSDGSSLGPASPVH